MLVIEKIWVGNSIIALEQHSRYGLPKVVPWKIEFLGNEIYMYTILRPSQNLMSLSFLMV